MQIIPNWHDAHALRLIDACLAKNSFPSDIVSQITAALVAAEQHNHASAAQRAADLRVAVAA
jgi:hypothetical protein